MHTYMVHFKLCIQAYMCAYISICTMSLFLNCAFMNVCIDLCLYIITFAYMPLFVNPAWSPLHKQIKSHIAKPLF